MFFIPKLELLILNSLFLPNLNLCKIYLVKLLYFLSCTKKFPAHLKISMKKRDRYFFQVLKHAFEKMYYENNTIRHNFQHIIYTFHIQNIYSFMKIILHNIQYYFHHVYFKPIHKMWYFQSYFHIKLLMYIDLYISFSY